MIVKKPVLWCGFAGILLLLGASALDAAKDNPKATRPAPVVLGTPVPTPIPMSASDMAPMWMTPPPPSTTQVGTGARVYYYNCMACHGDQGQGLTLDWRAQWPPGHQDCSVPQCHGKRHPDDGFEIPHNFAPAIVGSGTLARFDSAQQLYDFISTRMPFQAPGSLSSDEYWALAAFLLNRHGVVGASVHLDQATAKTIAVHPALADPMSSWALPGSVVSTLVLVAGVTGFALWRRRRR